MWYEVIDVRVMHRVLDMPYDYFKQKLILEHDTAFRGEDIC